VVRRAWGAVLLAAVLAGCGGGDDADRAATPTPVPLPTDPVEVTRAWAEAVRVNDLDRASRLFATPALVSNGTPLLKLENQTQVRIFNSSFPCGASFLRASVKGGGKVLTTYELTERAGAPAPCGSGTGARAGVLFTIRDGKITRWIRADPEQGPARTPEPQL
jgi:hypothetical protein